MIVRYYEERLQVPVREVVLEDFYRGRAWRRLLQEDGTIM